MPLGARHHHVRDLQPRVEKQSPARRIVIAARTEHDPRRNAAPVQHPARGDCARQAHGREPGAIGDALYRPAQSVGSPGGRLVHPKGRLALLPDRVQTQFEAFLSMRQVTAAGLGFAPEAERRCTIVPIHDAPKSIAQVLVDEWGSKTPEAAYKVLKGQDVKVTNQKDKDVQLPKLLALDDFSKRVIDEDAALAATAKAEVSHDAIA